MRLLLAVLVALLAVFVASRLSLPQPTGATRSGEVDLHDALCVSASARGITQFDHGDYRLRACNEPPRGDGWTWFRLRDAVLLDGLPAGWRLVLDTPRFRRIAIRVTDPAGHVQSIDHDPGSPASDPASDWAPGGLQRFAIETPGRDIAALDIGYLGLDGPRFARKFTARDPAGDARSMSLWLLVVGAMIGTLVCACIYSATLYSELRFPFQLWYIAWAVCALGYGLCWSNVLGYLDARLTGPLAVRFSDVWFGLMAGCGLMFLRELIEPRAQSARLRVLAWPLAAATAALGVVMACDTLLPPVPSDIAFNLVILAGVVWVICTSAVALARRSAVIGFYLAGWLPVIAVLALRLGRDDGLLPQSDVIDRAMFLALTFEALALSITTGHRLRRLRDERDAAEEAAVAMQTETLVLRRVAYVDPLTGLMNRSAYMEALEDLPPGAVLFVIDVDHLREINHSFGHRQGDALLLHLARRLQQEAAGALVIARSAGDEFAIIAVAEMEEAISARLDALQGEPWTCAGRILSLSMSIGQARAVAIVRPGLRPDSLVLREQADEALAESRRLGRGRRVRYSDALAPRHDRNAELIAELPHAIARREFELFYQPIVDLRDGRILAEEALLRWRHPVRGLLAPGSFEALLSDSSWGPILQDQVLSMALDHLAGTRAVAGYLTVNFTGPQLRGAGTARHILRRLEALDIPFHRLCVEVTESVALDLGVGEIVEALSLLHAAGVRVALDDFGTGYASLQHLRLFPIDIIKIDRSFVSATMSSETHADKIARSIVSLGESLDKLVIAEGVETDEQRLRLLSFGCRAGQGFLFSRPVPPSELPPRGSVLCFATSRPEASRSEPLSDTLYVTDES